MYTFFLLGKTISAMEIRAKTPIKKKIFHLFEKSESQLTRQLWYERYKLKGILAEFSVPKRNFSTYVYEILII